MKIENVKLSQIKANKSNPRVIKDHKFHKLVKSLLVFPKMLELRPIVVSSDMTILGGNMRFRALQHIAKLPENERIKILESSNDYNIKKDSDKEKLKAYWNVFCDSPIVPIAKANELSDAEQKEFIIKDNASFGEWDFDCLANEWDVEDLQDWGIDLPTFDIDEGEEEREIIEDEVPEVDEKTEPICKKGDIWQLGRHRLMCGDSTDKECVDKLMDEKKADMVFTDPPYNMNYCGAGFINQENKNVKERIKDIIDFDAKEISYLAEGNIANNVFIFTSKDLIKDYLVIFEGWNFNLLVWHKTNTPPMVNNNFFADTEYCLYFHKGKRIWNNGLKPIDIYKKYFVSGMHEGRKGAGNLHPTMKPIQFIANEVKICSNEKGIVVDVFGGSGSTLIACEQVNRSCYMCELDEHYCDVILQRYINFKGSDTDVFLLKDGNKIPYCEAL